jgi:hypothetical protein
LSDDDKRKLVEAMRSHGGIAADMQQYKDIRSSMLRQKPATFGPYFAQKVINRIQGMRVEIDRQIVFFFKKYQLAALGVFVALLTINIIFSEQLDLPSILGIQDTEATTVANTPEDDIETFNFLEALNSN